MKPWSLVLSILPLAACGAPPMTIGINFRGVVGAAPYVCGQAYTGIGTSSSTLTVNTFRMYVSQLRLVDTSGNEVPVTLDPDMVWQQGQVALLDLSDKAGACAMDSEPANRTVKGSVPAGSYAGLRFDMGLPFDIDHQDVSVASPPLDRTALFWSWASGYMFLRVDGTTTGQPDGYSVHIGSSDCQRSVTNQVTSCANQNLASISLTGFDPQSSAVAADLSQLLSGANVDVNAPGTAQGCLSEPLDPDCVPIFHNLGMAAPQDPAGSAFTQKFFRVQ